MVIKLIIVVRPKKKLIIMKWPLIIKQWVIWIPKAIQRRLSKSEANGIVKKIEKREEKSHMWIVLDIIQSMLYIH